MATKSLPIVERQKAYVASLQKNKFQFGIAVGAAFVRGIREIGYRHTGTALDEMIDNSYESGASNIHIVLHDDGSAGRKNNVSQIAIIDDGAGMIPEMIRVAVLWGGTDRENNRTGIGRFGYGLPSSCVSQGRRFEVYSAPEGGKVHMCAVDLDEIEHGDYNNESGEIIVPAAKATNLPRFVQDYVKEHLPDGQFTKGTVVVIDKLDKPTWKSINAMANNLMEHFGLVYNKLRGQFELFVDGKRVEPIDPLFLTPGFRWYDADADRAQALDPMQIEVKDKDTKAIIGRIRVRYAYLPPTFPAIDKTKPASKTNQNGRFAVMKDTNGFIISRMGRVIEVETRSPFWNFMTNDRYIKVELDFDASLDERFGVTTSKQGVTVVEGVWEFLEQHGVKKAMEQMRKKYNEGDKALKTAEEGGKGAGGKRASEQAMEEASKLNTTAPAAVAEKRAAEGQKRLTQEAEKRATETGKTTVQAQQEIEAELAGKPYKVATRSIPGGAFFEVEQWGGTKMLWLNTASRFFTEVYAGADSTPAVRAALEVLLFSIGDRVIDRDELRSFYAHEIPEWSRKLEYALAQLSQTMAGQPVETEPAEAMA